MWGDGRTAPSVTFPHLKTGLRVGDPLRSLDIRQPNVLDNIVFVAITAPRTLHRPLSSERILDQLFRRVLSPTILRIAFQIPSVNGGVH